MTGVSLPLTSNKTFYTNTQWECSKRYRYISGHTRFVTQPWTTTKMCYTSMQCLTEVNATTHADYYNVSEYVSWDSADTKSLTRARYLLFPPIREETSIFTTMGLKYPLKKFDSQWAFGMILLPYLVKIAIYGTMHHNAEFSSRNSPEARSRIKILSPRVRNIIL